MAKITTPSTYSPSMRPSAAPTNMSTAPRSDCAQADSVSLKKKEKKKWMKK
jgi:hypothetical protein